MDEYPPEVVPLISARILWQEYGIATDLSFQDALLALRLHGAEVMRQNNENKRASKK
jgi:hypothetical protein